MLTVNSLSGGKTSSYIAAHYPADLNVFSLVCIDDHNAGMHLMDPKLRQMVNDKLQKYCSNMPEFQSTAEDPLTIKAMFDLEQHIGSEITWVRGIDFTEAIRVRMSLPNRNKRWCTTILKITPIFWLLYLYFELPVQMRIGYRYDEKERADTFRESFKFPIYSQMWKKPVHGGMGNTEWFNRYAEVPFRIGEFPLIVDKVNKIDVNRYWADKDIVFPDDSNCQFCFWKKANQLRANFDTNPNIMFWAMITEAMNDNRFHDGISMNAIKESGLQTDLFGGSSCHGGYCTS